MIRKSFTICPSGTLDPCNCICGRCIMNLSLRNIVETMITAKRLERVTHHIERVSSLLSFGPPLLIILCRPPNSGRAH